MRGYYNHFSGVSPEAIYRAMLKRAAAVMTPEAMQAGAGGMPMDPSMQGGMPMDPAMAQGGMPMDPSMMQGGMPTQGGMPMDPSMMQGGMPMDPSMMQGGMPPQGAPMDPTMQGGMPPEILQDQAFMLALQQAGVIIDPSTGMAMDPSGQPIPPEMLMQAYAAFQQGQQQGQAQLAGAPPEELSAAPGGASGAVGGVSEEMMNAISSVVASTVEPALQDLTSQLGQALSDMAAKIDAIAEKVGKAAPQAQDDESSLRAEIEKDLLSQQQQPEMQAKAASVQPAQRRQSKPLNIFSFLNTNNN